MMIVELWRRQPGQYFCISTKNAAGRWRDTFFSRAELGKVKQFLSDNADKDCYFCVHGLSEKSRLKEYAERPKMLWSDMDEVDPRLVKYKPTIAIESSPGRYVGLWFLDSTMNDITNKRLNYEMGADMTGWDLSQVLRIPGTRNYKYKSMPKVRLLWEDGPTYRLKDLERKLPEAPDEGHDNEETSKRVMDYTKLEPQMSSKLRQLVSSQVQQGKRSDVLFKIGNMAKEEGFSRPEAKIILKSARCNKWAGWTNEDRQLDRELRKIYAHQMQAIPRDQKHQNGYNFFKRNMSEVEERQIDWLWRPYFARGEVTLFEGDPAIGKSYIMQMVSKALCDGDYLPCPYTKKRRLPVGKVAYCDMENDAGAVTRMRLKWNGCRNMANFFQEEEPFTMDDENAKKHLFEALESLRPTMVVFDTLNLYIGKADIAKANEATQAMAIFKQIATQFNCAVVLVRHLTKSGGVKALYRGQGNIAIGAMPRIILSIGTDPEDAETKALCHTKLSFARKPGGIRFHIESLPDTLRESDRSKLVWGDYDSSLNSDDVLNTEPAKNTSEEKNTAIEFLKEELDEGAKKVSEIETMAEKRSISKRTLYRAAEELGVVKKSTGFGAGKAATWGLANM